ncbi:hypothetical protein ACTFIW_008108 [Dictyostelium discoideum]
MNEYTESELKQQLEKTKIEKNDTEENIINQDKEIKNLIKLEAKIELLQTNTDQINYRIEKQNDILKTQDDKLKAQSDKLDARGAAIERLEKQMQTLMHSCNGNLKKSFNIDTINAIQDAALIGEQVYLVAVCQYYLEHCLLKEINDDKEEKDKISWDDFRCNYIKNKEAIKFAKGVELDKVLELCRDRNSFIHVNDEDEIKKIINNIKMLYSALPTPEARYKPYKKSLLRICRYITDDEEFNLN